MRRRELLKTAATLGGGVLLGRLDPDDRARLAAALADPGRDVSERVVRLLEGDAAAAQRHDRELPATRRAQLAHQHRTMARRLRLATGRPDHQQRLAVVEAQAARMAGRLAAFWHHDHAAATAAYQAALAAAEDAGPHAATLRAYTLGGIAFLDAQLGDRHAAVRTINRAVEIGEASQVQGLRCWLASTAATVHASVADRRACDRSLARADDLYVRPGPGDPAWMDFLGRSFLLQDRAACQLRTGRPRQALATLADAERLLPAHRLGRHALILGYQAQALVADGQLGDGAHTAADAVDLASRIGYQRVVGQVRALRHGRLHHARALPAVRDLDERLRLASNHEST